MALTFLNPTRSIDATVNCIRFSGYDGALEISFFLKIEALAKICETLSDVDSEILDAFDLRLKEIHKVATSVYKRNKRTYVCTLNLDDF